MRPPKIGRFSLFFLLFFLPSERGLRVRNCVCDFSISVSLLFCLLTFFIRPPNLSGACACGLFVSPSLVVVVVLACSYCYSTPFPIFSRWCSRFCVVSRLAAVYLRGLRFALFLFCFSFFHTLVFSLSSAFSREIRLRNRYSLLAADAGANALSLKAPPHAARVSHRDRREPPLRNTKRGASSSSMYGKGRRFSSQKRRVK